MGELKNRLVENIDVSLIGDVDISESQSLDDLSMPINEFA